MNGVTPPFGQPPQVWQEHRTPDGRSYFYNTITKVTQWTKPEEMMGAAEVSMLLCRCWCCICELESNVPSTEGSRESAMEGVHCRGRPEVLVQYRVEAELLGDARGL